MKMRAAMELTMSAMRLAVERRLQRRASLAPALSGRRRSGDSHCRIPAVSAIVVGKRLRPARVLKHDSKVSNPCMHAQRVTSSP